jgi:hypothetical protein
LQQHENNVAFSAEHARTHARTHTQALVNARASSRAGLLRTGKSWRSRGRATPESRRLILRAEVPASCPRGPRAFAYFSISIYHPRVFLFILLAARAKRASVAAVPPRFPACARARVVLLPSLTRGACIRSLVNRSASKFVVTGASIKAAVEETRAR